MRRLLAALAFLSLASFAFGQRIDELNGKHTQLYPTKDKAPGYAKPGGGGAQNLINHGGAVLAQAKVVSIFWGPAPTWGTNSNLSLLASEITGFFGQFGGTPEYKVISQYGANPTGLTSASWVDNTTPPQNVTDADVVNEVVNYFNHHGNLVDTSTVYEVFLPPGSYASFGTSDSCGGPNLVFCAYHSNFTYNGTIPSTDIKYASMPYPSCSGCQWPGFDDAKNFEHFACHETREAATDADGTAWYDRRGNEADDKCAWSPAPFIGTGGFGYQYEWSNAVSGCVKTSP
jgi:hypothetical protein